ncbi:MAG TPA: hypothetical protein VI953_02805 [Candidatus Paceibacterota bacterium]
MQRPLPKAVRDWARRKAMDLRNPLLANHVRKWGTWQDDKLRAFALWFFGQLSTAVVESAAEHGESAEVRLASIYSGRLNFVMLEGLTRDPSSRVAAAASLAINQWKAANPPARWADAG